MKDILIFFSTFAKEKEIDLVLSFSKRIDDPWSLNQSKKNKKQKAKTKTKKSPKHFLHLKHFYFFSIIMSIENLCAICIQTAEFLIII